MSDVNGCQRCKTPSVKGMSGVLLGIEHPKQLEF